MKKTKLFQIFLFAVLTLPSYFSFSQNIPVVHLKKEQSLFFFQKGIKCDRIQKDKSDLFYLSVPDSLKPNLSILTENGQLQPTEQDSTYKFVYLKGLKYESLFLKNGKQAFDFKVLINGTSELDPQKIRIQFFNKKTGQTILENNFLYKQE